MDVQDRISFLLQAAYYSITCMLIFYQILFIHLSVEGHLGCFYLLAIVTSVAVNMGIQIFLQDLAYTFFKKRNTSRTEMSGSYGSSTLNILKNLHTNFHSDCIILCSHEQ